MSEFNENLQYTIDRRWCVNSLVIAELMARRMLDPNQGEVAFGADMDEVLGSADSSSQGIAGVLGKFGQLHVAWRLAVPVSKAQDPVVLLDARLALSPPSIRFLEGPDEAVTITLPFRLHQLEGGFPWKSDIPSLPKSLLSVSGLDARVSFTFPLKATQPKLGSDTYEFMVGFKMPMSDEAMAWFDLTDVQWTGSLGAGNPYAQLPAEYPPATHALLQSSAEYADVRTTVARMFDWVAGNSELSSWPSPPLGQAVEIPLSGTTEPELTVDRFRHVLRYFFSRVGSDLFRVFRDVAIDQSEAKQPELLWDTFVPLSPALDVAVLTNGWSETVFTKAFFAVAQGLFGELGRHGFAAHEPGKGLEELPEWRRLLRTPAAANWYVVQGGLAADPLATGGDWLVVEQVTGYQRLLTTAARSPDSFSAAIGTGLGIPGTQLVWRPNLKGEKLERPWHSPLFCSYLADAARLKLGNFESDSSIYTTMSLMLQDAFKRIPWTLFDSAPDDKEEQDFIDKLTKEVEGIILEQGGVASAASLEAALYKAKSSVANGVDSSSSTYSPLLLRLPSSPEVRNDPNFLSVLETRPHVHAVATVNRQTELGMRALAWMDLWNMRVAQKRKIGFVDNLQPGESAKVNYSAISGEGLPFQCDQSSDADAVWSAGRTVRQFIVEFGLFLEPDSLLNKLAVAFGAISDFVEGSPQGAATEKWSDESAAVGSLCAAVGKLAATFSDEAKFKNVLDTLHTSQPEALFVGVQGWTRDGLVLSLLGRHFLLWVSTELVKLVAAIAQVEDAADAQALANAATLAGLAQGLLLGTGLPVVASPDDLKDTSMPPTEALTKELALAADATIVAIVSVPKGYVPDSLLSAMEDALGSWELNADGFGRLALVNRILFDCKAYQDLAQQVLAIEQSQMGEISQVLVEAVGHMEQQVYAWLKISPDDTAEDLANAPQLVDSLHLAFFSLVVSAHQALASLGSTLLNKWLPIAQTGPAKALIEECVAQLNLVQSEIAACEPPPGNFDDRGLRLWILTITTGDWLTCLVETLCKSPEVAWIGELTIEKRLAIFGPLYDVALAMQGATSEWNATSSHILAAFGAASCTIETYAWELAFSQMLLPQFLAANGRDFEGGVDLATQVSGGPWLKEHPLTMMTDECVAEPWGVCLAEASAQVTTVFSELAGPGLGFKSTVAVQPEMTSAAAAACASAALLAPAAIAGGALLTAPGLTWTAMVLAALTTACEEVASGVLEALVNTVIDAWNVVTGDDAAHVEIDLSGALKDFDSQFDVEATPVSDMGVPLIESRMETPNNWGAIRENVGPELVQTVEDLVAGRRKRLDEVEEEIDEVALSRAVPDSVPFGGGWVALHGAGFRPGLTAVEVDTGKAEFENAPCVVLSPNALLAKLPPVGQAVIGDESPIALDVVVSLRGTDRRVSLPADSPQAPRHVNNSPEWLPTVSSIELLEGKLCAFRKDAALSLGSIKGTPLRNELELWRRVTARRDPLSEIRVGEHGTDYFFRISDEGSGFSLALADDEKWDLHLEAVPGHLRLMVEGWALHPIPADRPEVTIDPAAAFVAVRQQAALPGAQDEFGLNDLLVKDPAHSDFLVSRPRSWVLMSPQGVRLRLTLLVDRRYLLKEGSESILGTSTEYVFRLFDGGTVPESDFRPFNLEVSASGFPPSATIRASTTDTVVQADWVRDYTWYVRDNYGIFHEVKAGDSLNLSLGKKVTVQSISDNPANPALEENGQIALSGSEPMLKVALLCHRRISVVGKAIGDDSFARVDVLLSGTVPGTVPTLPTLPKSFVD